MWPTSCARNLVLVQRSAVHVGRRGLAGCLVVAALFAPIPAWGYRPFVSTDAAVADPKEVEIELGFLLEHDKGENTLLIPRMVLNYGLFENWEAVGEFAVRRSPGADLDVIESALSLKGVLKQGVLQDKEGVAIAVELSALLPSTEKAERNFGFEGVGILSGKLAPFIYHVNAGLGVERSNGDLVGIWGVIGELPVVRGLRVVGEINGEKPRREEEHHSALLGLIWQPWTSKNVWFDGGVRRGFGGGAPDWQFTLGVTFGFSAASLAQRLICLGGLDGASGVNGSR